MATRMSKYKIVWYLKYGKNAGKERVDYVMAMNSMSAKNKFKREIGGGSDVVIKRITLA